MNNILRQTKLFSGCLISILIGTSWAWAQDSLAQYHPLSNGNISIYRVTVPHSRTWYKYDKIIGDSLVKGKKYHIINDINTVDTFTRISLARFDTSTGCYYTRATDTDILEDSTLTFTAKASFAGSYNCKLFVRLDTGIVFQTLTTIREITEGKLIKEDQMYWSYAYGLGLIFQMDIDLTSYDTLQIWELVYAKIDQKEFGSIPVSVRTKADRVASPFALSQNYPNPFNPLTTISFDLPSRLLVSLKVFDILGREISTIVSGELGAGSYSKQWDASNIPSGVYFYRLQAGSFRETKKLLLLK